MIDKVYRGQIYYADLPDLDGPVQRGKRPVVIVSNNIGNNNSGLVTVVPITTKAKKELPTHFYIFCGKIYGTVLCEQVQAIDKSWLGDYATSLTRFYTERLNECLSVALNLNGDFGEAFAPECDKVVDNQIKELEKLKKTYDYELLKLRSMIGYKDDTSFTPLISDISDEVIEPEKPPVEKKKVRKYNKRTLEQITRFIEEWEDPYNDKQTVAENYGFSTKGIAATFYKRHKED